VTHASVSARASSQLIGNGCVGLAERIDEFTQALTWLALHERANGKQSVA
jgi:hypothetical protein